MVSRSLWLVGSRPPGARHGPPALPVPLPPVLPLHATAPHPDFRRADADPRPFTQTSSRERGHCRARRGRTGAGRKGRRTGVEDGVDGVLHCRAFRWFRVMCKRGGSPLDQTKKSRVPMPPVHVLSWSGAGRARAVQAGQRPVNIGTRLPRPGSVTASPPVVKGLFFSPPRRILRRAAAPPRPTHPPGKRYPPAPQRLPPVRRPRPARAPCPAPIPSRRADRRCRTTAGRR